MEKIKQFFSNIWAKIAAIALAVVAFLLWLLNTKQHKINSLTAQLDLASTKEEVVKIETEIKDIQKNRNLAKHELDELSEAMVKLEDKKLQLAKEAGKLTDKEILEYWNS